MKATIILSVLVVVVLSVEVSAAKRLVATQSNEQGQVVIGTAGKSSKPKAKKGGLLGKLAPAAIADPVGEVVDTAGESVAAATGGDGLGSKLGEAKETLEEAAEGATGRVAKAAGEADGAGHEDGGHEGGEDAETTTEKPKKKKSKKGRIAAGQVQGKEQKAVAVNKNGIVSISQKDGQKQSISGASRNSKASTAGKQKQKQSQSVSVESNE